MKKLILGMFCLSMALQSLLAQLGNEWIDFDKTYYKFKIAEDGIYRILPATLTTAGFGNVPGAQFRLYHMGTEVPIYTTTEGVFSAPDFIEFYGKQNRGELDSTLFQLPDAEQLNPRYSMFNDSSTYFLTWQETGQGLRITQIQNDLSNPPPAETYYMHKDEWLYTDHSLDPRNYGTGSFVSYSRYQECEGFASQDYRSFDLDIPSSMVVNSGPEAMLALRFASSNLNGHDIIVQFGSDTLTSDANLLGFHLYQASDTLSAGAVLDNQLLHISDQSTTGTFAIAYVDWTYPRSYDFTGEDQVRFTHPAVGSAQYFDFANFSDGGQDPVVYDLHAGVRLFASRSGNNVRFLLPADTGARDIIVVSQATAIHLVTALTEQHFVDYTSDNTEYIIITNPALRSGADVVQAYADYRSSAIGGGYRVGIYSITDLYDQFGYGIAKHPQAIRNFCKMVRNSWSDVKMALIIGKGIVYTQSRVHGSEEEQNTFVPTFGNPGADNLLFTENGKRMPPFPIGRLPVTDPVQLQTYLSKLIEYDLVSTLPQTLKDKGWTKQILHMGGGADADQQGQILDYLNQMAGNVINTEFGARVTTFTKTTTNSTGESNSDRILDILESGASIVKFFGHSSASTLDFQINNPRDWHNKGKYPIFSAMGCQAGDIFKNFSSLSENFVFEPDAGTIAFLAGSGSQFLNTLGDWGADWYLTFGQGVNTLTLGESIRNSMEALNQSNSLAAVLLTEQQTLNGDPAIRFYSTPGPDYVWDYTSVNHTPEILTTNEQSFTLSADAINIGTNSPDSVVIRVDQKFPNGSVQELYLDTVYMSSFRTPLEFEIPVDRAASGLNTFYLTLDPFNDIIELPDPAAEENNTLSDASGKQGVDVFILDNRARATYPLEFSIVTEQNPELIASSSNAFVKGAHFVMELDTTPDFKSPSLLREFFSGFGGVLKWKPDFNFIPGTVYYWRVSTDNGNQDYLWDTSSFLYNPGGQKGWNQSHYGQFQRDILQSLDFDTRNQLVFDTVYRNIWVQNKVNFDPDLLDDPAVYINNTLRRDFFTFYDTLDAHIFAIVIDSFSARFLQNSPGGLYGSVNPTPNIIVVFPFNTSTPEGRNSFMSFLTDVVGDGMYVILYTYQRANYMDYFPEEWEGDEQMFGRSIFSVLEAQAPGSQIRSLKSKGSVPYLLFYRKNYEILNELIANQLDETISYDYSFISHDKQGDLISTFIGPAKKWRTFEWTYAFSENPENDIVDAELVALSKTMLDTLKLNILNVQDTTLDFIDATQYPYMYLTFHVADQPNLSPASIDYWRVLYDGVPDLLINPSGGFEFEGDSLMIGQPMNLTTGIENLGAGFTEDFQVRFTITDNKNKSTVLTENVPALESGESALVHISKEMLDGAGRNTLVVELNPDRIIDETTYLNNTGVLNFTLLADQVAPTLDVTFDGRHLVDGDIVSSKPHIVAQLQDDNPYILLNEREDFELYLRYPGDFDYTQIDVHSPEIQFDPATSGEANVATLMYSPILADGYYDMLIHAHDRNNNDAGSIDYSISFEVLGNQLLSRVVAEPPLFSDFTRFIFTISGTDIPSEINLQIANAGGQIVREIGKDEIGLFVGTTEYIWNGTSDSGTVLPAGIYFYRLDAKDKNGNTYNYLGPGLPTLRGARAGKVVIVR